VGDTGIVDVRAPRAQLLERLRIAKTKSDANTAKQEAAKAKQAEADKEKQELDKQEVSGPTSQSLRANAEKIKSTAKAEADRLRCAAEEMERDAEREANKLEAEAKRKEKIADDRAAVEARRQEALHEIALAEETRDRLKKEEDDCHEKMKKLDECEKYLAEINAFITRKHDDPDDDNNDGDDDDGRGAGGPPSKRPRSDIP